MEKSETSQNDDEATHCRWCESELNPLGATAADAVCRRCYHLLLKAGVSEEEILSGRQERRPSWKEILKNAASSAVLISSTALLN